MKNITTPYVDRKRNIDGTIKKEDLKKCPRHEWFAESYKPYVECHRCGKRRAQKAK